MKKSASVLWLICSSVIALNGCSKVENSVESSVDEKYLSSEEEMVEEEIPTDRVPDIHTEDEFEYEIIDGSAVITGYTGSSVSVEIPDEIGGAAVTKIGPYAFEAEYDITSITLPETVTILGEGAFMDCGSLAGVNIPEAVTAIERGVFVGCVSLTEMTIPANVEYVREEAFTACEAMTSLTIENPDLAYENWGLEELPELRIYAPDGSAAAAWVESMGKLAK